MSLKFDNIFLHITWMISVCLMLRNTVIGKPIQSITDMFAVQERLSLIYLVNVHKGKLASYFRPVPSTLVSIYLPDYTFMTHI